MTYTGLLAEEILEGEIPVNDDSKSNRFGWSGAKIQAGHASVLQESFPYHLQHSQQLIP